MTATEKLAHKRLTLLQLAERLGNISKACRMHKVSRSQFYEYKRAFQQHGLEGLVDKPPVPGSHPSQLSKKTTNRVIALSLEHPAFGQQRIADQLALEGLSVCPTSVRNGMKNLYLILRKAPSPQRSHFIQIVRVILSPTHLRCSF